MGGDRAGTVAQQTSDGASAGRIPRRRATWDLVRGCFGHARARSWPSVALGAAVLGALGFVGQNQAVLLPMVDREIDLRTVYVVVGVLIVTVPLYVTIPDLVRTLPRERPLRVARPLGVVALQAVILVPSVPWDDPGVALPDVRLAALLLAIGIVAATTLGPRGWIVPFGAGLSVLLLDGSYTQPVTAFLAVVGVGPLCVLLACAIAVAAFAPVRVSAARE